MVLGFPNSILSPKHWGRNWDSFWRGKSERRRLAEIGLLLYKCEPSPWGRALHCSGLANQLIAEGISWSITWFQRSQPFEKAARYAISFNSFGRVVEMKIRRQKHRGNFQRSSKKMFFNPRRLAYIERSREKFEKFAFRGNNDRLSLLPRDCSINSPRISANESRILFQI